MTEEEFNVLVNQHRDVLIKFLLHRYARSLDWVEDIVQESFMRAYFNIHRFDPTKKFRTWLFSIAINVANSDLSRNRELLLEDALLLSVADKDPEISLVLAKVHQVIDTLSVNHQRVLKPYLFEQLSIEEISEQIKKPAFVTKNRINFALKELVKQYYIAS